jgi:hypothetical protein
LLQIRLLWLGRVFLGLFQGLRKALNKDADLSWEEWKRSALHRYSSDVRLETLLNPWLVCGTRGFSSTRPGRRRAWGRSSMQLAGIIRMRPSWAETLLHFCPNYNIYYISTKQLQEHNITQMHLLIVCTCRYLPTAAQGRPLLPTISVRSWSIVN